MFEATRVICIRHGETDWNAEGRWQGRAPVPLNTAGLEQSQILGRYLAEHGPAFDALYSSHLKRAMQTAQAIAAALQIEQQPEPRFCEADLGDWQGLTRAEAEAWDGERYARYAADRMTTPLPNGESWADVKVRARAAFDELTARHRGQSLAIVTHGGTLGLLLESLFGPINRPTLTNTSLTIVEQARPTESWYLVKIAWTPHLDGAPMGETW